jgi:HNH endonuclease
VKPRLGQSSFRVLVTDAYKRRCAITGENTLVALEAAHIVPYSKDGSHEIRNGLLLRADFHRLFRACAAVSAVGLSFNVLDDRLETSGGKQRIESVVDDADPKEVYNTERHRLYVAGTRARDHLLITSIDPASEFLDDLRR